MIIIILSVIGAVYALIGLSLATGLWKSNADTIMREFPYSTDSEIKPLIFLQIMCLWPLCIAKISMSRSEGSGIGIEFVMEEDDEEDRH